MPTIASANQNNIRPAMDVFIHVQQLQDTALTVSQNSGKIADLTSLQMAGIDLRKLTDFQQGGFPLDGSCDLYDEDEPATATNGKVGIRTNIGTAMTVTVSAGTTINALTLRVFGSGTITANNVTYDVREFMVIPVNATSITMTVTPDENTRISIEDISAGIVLDFNNDNLISCTLDLESDLAITDSSWRISSIEVQGYYPDDISEAVGNMTDGTPIIYYAGYSGDYSTPRFFYVSEAVTQRNNLITIKGEDASSRFDNYTQPEELWQTTRQNVRRQFYRKLASLVNGAGITLESKEADPPLSGSNTTKHTVMLKEGTYREYVQYMMTITNKNGFFPRFVDAGIPTLRWSEPTVKWDIYKEDIGEYEQTVDRNVNKIYGDDAEMPLHAELNVASKKTTIDAKNVKKGKSYNVDYGDNYYYNVTWENGILKKLSDKTLHSLKLTAEQTTDSVKVRVRSGWTTKTKKFKKGTEIRLVQDVVVIKKTKSKDYITVTWKEPKYVTKTEHHPQMLVKGNKITQKSGASNMVTASRLGITKEEKTMFWGRFLSNYNGTSYYIPNYNDFFSKSNVGGSFTYKGNPHMQPRDVFRLYELDGETYTVCTIESIETTHEDGGMKSVITFREGVY